jgi:hypothetical protein
MAFSLGSVPIPIRSSPASGDDLLTAGWQGLQVDAHWTNQIGLCGHVVMVWER